MRIGLGLGLGAGTVPAVPFVPTDLAALAFWLRADSLASGAIASWNDQSLAGDSNRNAASISGTPTKSDTDAAFNNQAVVNIGISDHLKTGTWSAAIAQPCAVFAVFKGNAAGAASDYIFDSLSGGTQLAGIINQGSNSVDGFAGTTQIASSVSGTAAATFALWEFNGASSKVYVNSLTAAVTGNAGANGATGLTIGRYAGGGTFGLDGKMAEIGLLTAIPNLTDRTKIAQYCATRYALSITGL